jgi:hypothetical protein
MNKQQIEDLAERINAEPAKCYRVKLIEQALEQIPPVVVGLSDKQVKDLAGNFFDDEYTSKQIKRWLKTQTFSHYNNEGKVYELDGSVTDYRELYEKAADSFVSLEEEYSKLKAQQWQPNWDDAPKSATFCQVKRVWLDALGIPVAFKVLIDEQRPTPPAPIVEVGQVWEYIGKEVYITPTRFTVVDVSEDGVICEQNTSFMIWKGPLSDFLAKFESVQP